MFDLKIIGGTVVDGTGAERYHADIGIKDGKIVDVVRRGAGDPAMGGLRRHKPPKPSTPQGVWWPPASSTSTPTTTAR